MNSKKRIIVLGVLMIALMGCNSENVLETKNANDSLIKKEESVKAASKEELDFSYGETNPVAGALIKGVNTVDVQGQAVSDENFRNKITVINLWGTFCGPCIEEMPHFEKISNDYKDKGVRFIGIVDSYEKQGEVIKMLKDLGVTYQNIIAKEKLTDELISKFDYVPATLFVDEKGRILETFVAGSITESDMRKLLDQLLE